MGEYVLSRFFGKLSIIYEIQPHCFKVGYWKVVSQVSFYCIRALFEYYLLI